MAGKKPIVRVRAFRGTELNYDANGNIKNENNTIAYEHGTKLWGLFLKNIKLNGYCKVSIESVNEVIGDSQYKIIEDVSKFEKELKDAFEGKVVTKLTPDQKRIAELEAKIEKLINANSNEKETVKELEVSSNPKEIKDKVIDIHKKTIEDVRIEYEEVVGKKAHHMAKMETLIKEIEQTK